jgi:peptidyl-prolyl cis-trans isomerase A (cyclophilin A)
MLRSRALIPAAGLLWLACASAAPGPSPPAPARVRFETEAGAFIVELDARAPRTVENFLRYVDGGFYDRGRFHRTVTTAPDNQPDKTVKIDVIQGGADPAREAASFAPIALERTSATGVRHVDGAISMARDGPDSATSDFFVCVGDQPELDFGGRRNPDGQGFAAFGRVIEGMDVVRKIHAAPAEGQTLTPPIRIERARRLP